MKPDYTAAAGEGPAASETLPALEQRLAERPLDLELLGEA